MSTNTNRVSFVFKVKRKEVDQDQEIEEIRKIKTIILAIQFLEITKGNTLKKVLSYIFRILDQILQK